ncbi:MAG: hypothetical protein N2254_05740 [bacterium]|nr:hypothetical protein [bacterium]
MTGNHSNHHCRCKEPPYDCTLGDSNNNAVPYSPRNLINNPFTIPQMPSSITIYQISISPAPGFTINNITCNISVVNGSDACPGYYPIFTDYVRLQGNIYVTLNVTVIVDERGFNEPPTVVAGIETYVGEITVVAPIDAGFNIFLRHTENFFSTPDINACVGTTLQDVSLSLAYITLGDPAFLGLRWTSLPAGANRKRALAKLISFIEIQLRYQAFNQTLFTTLPVAERPYIGPLSVFDLVKTLGTDMVLNPVVRSCRSEGSISWIQGGKIYYDLGIETAFCTDPGYVQIRGAVDIDLDYDDVPGVVEPGTRGCACPAVSGSGTTPCGGSHICGAVHCSLFQRLFCLLVNERVLDFEDPPASGIPISRNSPGLGEVIGGILGTCEFWSVLIPRVKSFCPQGSAKLMGIRAVPVNCGSVQCGVNVLRPQSGALASYPTDISFNIQYDFEFWINDPAAGGWRRLMSFNPLEIIIGLNLAWWRCAAGPRCNTTLGRVLYAGLVIDPNILGVQTDSTHPSFPGPSGWNQVIADLIGLILSGNLFGAGWVGTQLLPVILDPDALLANPPNLDPVPNASYTPGSFSEPDLTSSFDVNAGFLRVRFDITGATTGRWITDFMDKQIGVAPTMNKIDTILVYYTEPRFDGLVVKVDSVGAEIPVFYYSVDGGAWRIHNSSYFELGPFTEGNHKIKIFVADLKKQIFDETPLEIDFIIDSLGPDIYTNLPDVIPTDFVLAVKTIDTFTKEDEIQISYSIDDAQFSDWTYNKTLVLNLDPGHHKIAIRARDKKGNIGFWEKKFYVHKFERLGCGRS